MAAIKVGPKVAVIYYSTWGHVKQMADAEVKGITAAGGTADVYQVQETLPSEVLAKMYAPGPDTSVPVITPDLLATYDAFLIGVPTRYGNFPAQWKTFWDNCGRLWQSNALHGKFVGLFVATGGMGGGQESTAIATMSTFAHMGLVYVPLGYKHTPELLNLTEVHGGSPWGAGTFSDGNGSRQPSALELKVAEAQGKSFYEFVSKAIP